MPAAVEGRLSRRPRGGAVADPASYVAAVRAAASGLGQPWQQGVPVTVLRSGDGGRLFEILPIKDGIEWCWVKLKGYPYSGQPGTVSAATKIKLTEIRLSS